MYELFICQRGTIVSSMKDILIFSVILVSLLDFSFCNQENEVIEVNAKEETVIKDVHKPVYDEWKMRHFPEKSDISSSDPRSMFSDIDDMISVNPECDDGKTNLIVDWDESVLENYNCTGDIICPNFAVAPIIHGNLIPPEFTAPHLCMDSEIKYSSSLVTFGPHRPLWGRYGEYEFIPMQRWLHNAEHGAVVMIYHPCADPKQVNLLRTLVTSCLYRHVITPNHLLPMERPLALITWGWYLGMNVVRPKLVQRFILEHALQAPEDLDLDGKYDHALIKPAKIVSDHRDSVLCANYM